MRLLSSTALPYATNSYSYNTNLNLMLTSTDPLGHTCTYAYDVNCDLTSSTDANGNLTTNTYDSHGNLTQTSDALRNTTVNVYSDGLLVNSQDPIDTTNLNSYDNYENIIATAQLDASGKILSTNTFAYDANGNRTNSTTWRNVGGVWTPAITTYVYDAMNRVIQTIDPDGGTNTVVYNAIGKQQATIDALGNTTSYNYDNVGRLIQEFLLRRHNRRIQL